MPDTPLVLHDKIMTRLNSEHRFVTFDARVPDSAANAYVVVYSTGGDARRERLTAVHNVIRWETRIVCCGRSPSQAINTTNLVRDLLTDWRPDDDPATSPLNERDDGAALVKDETDLTDVRYSFTLHYRLSTVRNPSQ